MFFMTNRKRALLERALRETNGSFEELRRRSEEAERSRGQAAGGGERRR